MNWLVQNAIDYFHLAYNSYYIDISKDDLPIKSAFNKINLNKPIKFYFDSTPFYFVAEKRPEPYSIHLRLEIHKEIIDCWCQPDDPIS
jgi:hypothetical protein